MLQLIKFRVGDFNKPVMKIYSACSTIASCKTALGTLAARTEQNVICLWKNPIYARSSMATLKGNLAMEGAVARISGIKNRKWAVAACRLDSDEACMETILA